MAEQTPESLSDHEPSMEDILASIRKLIAEDDTEDGSVAELPETTVPELKAVEDSLHDPRDIDPFDLSGLDTEQSGANELTDMVEFDLTEIENDIDLTTDAKAPEADLDVNEIEDVLDLTEILEAADDDFVELENNDDAMQSAQVANTVENDLAEDDIDLASMLGDMDVDGADDTNSSHKELFDGDLDDFLSEDLELSEPAPTLEPKNMRADDRSSMGGKSAADTEDMDLVKSLMADLTGSGLEEDAPDLNSSADDGALDDLTDELLGGLIGDEEALLADDATSEESEVSDDELASDVNASLDNDVDLNAILSGGQDQDELADLISELSAEADASSGRAQALAQQPEPEDILDLTVYDMAEFEAESDVTEQHDDEDEDLLSDLVDELSEESEELDIAETLTAAGMAAGAAAAVSAASELTNDADDDAFLGDELSFDETESDMDYDTVDEDKYMPRIVKADSLTSNEQATGAGSAFASLNKVVEEKAVFAERGPRIGDLVQDALRPMLSEWLDENLEAIVERAVAKEIQRISSGK